MLEDSSEDQAKERAKVNWGSRKNPGNKSREEQQKICRF